MTDRLYKWLTADDMSHDECLRPKYKVGEKVRAGKKPDSVFLVTGIQIRYELDDAGYCGWAEDELSPLPAHVHQFVCECGEAK